MSVFQHSKRLVLLSLTIILIAVGVISRGMALFGELWLDEQWSCLQVSSISSPVEIFTRLLHDNNHPFNSLWIYLNGSFASPERVRFPALICGVATLFLIIRYAPRLFGERVASLWLLLCLLSYNLILFSSEARGYALLVLCATWCFLLALRAGGGDTERPSPLLFTVVATLGCLAHAAFIMLLAPLIAWSCATQANRSSPLGLNSWSCWAFIPVTVVGSILAIGFYSKLAIGGAPILPHLQVFLSTLAVSVGGEELSASNPALSAWMSLLALGVIAAVVAETVAWIREDKRVGILIALLLATPVLAVVISSPHFILPRYFLFQTVIVLLVLSRFIVRLANRSKLGVALGVILVGAYIVGNMRLTWQLLTWGRSSFEMNRRGIISLYPPEQRTLGATQEFQTGIRMRYGESWFVAHGAGDGGKVALLKDYTNASPGPLYVLRESPDRFERFPTSFTTNSGVTYTLAWTNPAPISSGAQAAWYMREDLYRERYPAGMRVP